MVKPTPLSQSNGAVNSHEPKDGEEYEASESDDDDELQSSTFYNNSMFSV